MTTATALFEGALTWLEESYGDYRFFQERDLVWVIQRRISDEIASQRLPYRVFNDHTIIGRERADLVILDSDDTAVLVAEFKYEPSHARSSKRGGDIWYTKFDVVFWTAGQKEQGSVEKDIQRVRNYVKSDKAKVGYSILIDEGRHFRRRDPFPGSEWVDWPSGVSVLLSRQTPPEV